MEKNNVHWDASLHTIYQRKKKQFLRSLKAIYKDIMCFKTVEFYILSDSVLPITGNMGHQIRKKKLMFYCSK